MNAQETALIVGAIVGLMGAIQAWLVARSVSHEKQLNGLMTPRIQAGAENAIALDHGARSEAPTIPVQQAAAPSVTLPVERGPRILK